MNENATRHWVFLILILGIVLSAGSGLLLHYSEKEQLNHLLAKDLADRAAGLDREISASLEALYVMRALFIERDLPDDNLFIQLSEQTRTRHPDIEAFYWVGVMDREGRVASERKLRTILNNPDFTVLERSESGELSVAGAKGEYHPVIYREPIDFSSVPVGLDMSSDILLESVFTQAINSRQLVLSPGILQGAYGEDLAMVQAVVPVYKKLDSDRVIGFIVAIINLSRTFDDTLADIRISGIDMKLWDMTDAESPVVLHEHNSRTRLPVNQERAIRQPLNPIGYRQWELEGLPTFYYFDSKTNWLPHLVFLAGMASTLLIMRLFIVFASNSERAEQKSRQLMTSNQELAEISRTDALTGVANRRYFDEVLNREWKRAVRNSTPLTLIMVDIDCFKLYNDYYGHLEGDECIRMVAQSLKSVTSRPMDLVARYGGEEFAVLLPDTNENAIVLAQQACDKVLDMKIVHASSRVSPFVTVSMGICTLTPDPEMDIAEIIRQADRALYKSKENGRNQVSSAQITMERLSDGPGKKQA